MTRFRPKFRRGSSLLELEVAFVAFGVIISGLCPIVVAQMRHVKKLEARFQPGTVYYVVPRTQPWTQKLAGTASVTSTYYGSSGPSSPGGTNTVSVIAIEASPTVEDATVTVQVVPVAH